MTITTEDNKNWGMIKETGNIFPYRNELLEVMKAYSDCGLSHGERNLHFRASGAVPRNMAIAILEIAGVKNYNLFDYNLLLKFDESCWFKIAREGSVCLYVTRPNTSVAMPTAEEVDADEMALDEAEDNSLNTFRYWWD